MPSLEKYLEHADDLVIDVVNAWALHVSAGNAVHLTADFKVVFEKANRYRTAKQTADNRREFNHLSEHEAAEEKTTRESFAKACKNFMEKHQATLGGVDVQLNLQTTATKNRSPNPTRP